ncbi:hypothetical protein Tco_1429669 [Tanacetum coccineum]
MVAYLKKPEGSEGFHQIVDFLNVSHIRYALTENPTIYVSHIKQFWHTATARTLDNGEQELTATVDGKVKTITESSVRRHLKLADDGVSQTYKRQTRQKYEVPQPGSPTHTHVADEAVSFGEDDRMERAATTVSSIEAGQDSGVEDASKQERKIDMDAGDVSTAGADINAASVPVSTAGVGVSTASPTVSTASPTINTASPTRTADVSASKHWSISEGVQQRIRMSLDEELAQKLHEEEQARFNAEQEAKFNAEQEELLARETTEDEANPSVADIYWDDVQAQI